MYRRPIIALWATATITGTTAAIDAAYGIVGEARPAVLAATGIAVVSAILLHVGASIRSETSANRERIAVLASTLEETRDWVEAGIFAEGTKHHSSPPIKDEPKPVVRSIRIRRDGRDAIIGVNTNEPIDEDGIWAALDAAEQDQFDADAS